jgi:hypothetical protein
MENVNAPNVTAGRRLRWNSSRSSSSPARNMSTAGPDRRGDRRSVPLNPIEYERPDEQPPGRPDDARQSETLGNDRPGEQDERRYEESTRPSWGNPMVPSGIAESRLGIGCCTVPWTRSGSRSYPDRE